MNYIRSVVLILCVMFLANAQAQQTNILPGKISSPDPGWQRHFRISFAPHHSAKLERCYKSWVDLASIKTRLPNESDFGWIEYFPIKGQPIWCVLLGGTGIPTGTTDYSDPKWIAQIMADPDSCPRVGSFVLPEDTDGRGYRIWNKDRTQLVGEQFFNIEDYSKLKVELVPVGIDSFIVNVDSSNVMPEGISVQYSLEESEWSDIRYIGNHQEPWRGDIGHFPHFPSDVLAKNPNPWVEIDVFINLVTIRRRFRFGTNQPPILNPPPHHGHEPLLIDKMKRAQQWKEEQERERQAASDAGKVWTPTAMPEVPELAWAWKDPK